MTYHLDAHLRIEQRANDTISIYYGPLLYALHIKERISTGPPKDWAHQRPLPEQLSVPQAHDYVITNGSAWAVAIDPSTLKIHDRGASESTESSSIPQNDFSRREDGQGVRGFESAAASGTYMTARACEIRWGYERGVAAEPPGRGERRCLGPPFEVRLVPYGMAKIHMAELPTVDLGMGGWWKEDGEGGNDEDSNGTDGNREEGRAGGPRAEL